MKKPVTNKVSLIYAVNKVGTIGDKNDIPWKIEGDLPRFKRITSGNTVVMGRRTFESLKSKPLSERINIVVSTSLDPRPGILVARTPEQVMDIYRMFGQGDLFVIGGATLYKEFFNVAHRLYMTVVENSIKGDTIYQAPLREEVWSVASVQTVNSQDGTLSHTYLNLLRR